MTVPVDGPESTSVLLRHHSNSMVQVSVNLNLQDTQVSKRKKAKKSNCSARFFPLYAVYPGFYSATWAGVGGLPEGAYELQNGEGETGFYLPSVSSPTKARSWVRLCNFNSAGFGASGM